MRASLAAASWCCSSVTLRPSAEPGSHSTAGAVRGKAADGRARQDGAQAEAAPCGLKDDAVHDEQVADGVGERFLEVAGERAAGDVQHVLADARDVPDVGVHGVEGAVGAEHAHPQKRHAADGYVLDRVGLLVGIAACCCVVGQDVRVDPRGHCPAF